MIKMFRQASWPEPLVQEITKYGRRTFIIDSEFRDIANEVLKKLPKELIRIANEILYLSNYVEPGIIPLAQLIESAYLLLKSSEILDNYESKPSLCNDKVRLSGTGIAVVEAPRGILLHEYTVSNGIVRYSNIITPTTFFAADIEDSIKQYTLSKIGSIASLSDLESKISEIVRCYDPCISCSVHIIRIKPKLTVNELKNHKLFKS